MNTLSFTKMHGLGNDFMIVDATVEPFALSCRQIQDCADRHRGVGFDQLLVVAPPANQQTDFTYLIYNSDGSSAQQCGNGARCLAKFIHAHGLSTKKALSLQTADKITRVFIEDDGTVTVEMAEPYFTPEQIPFIDPGSGEPYYFEIGGQKHHFHIAGVGNPHAVILTESLDPAVVASVGGQLSVHTNFP
jgi:diaminopimelate epimerase